MKKHNDTITVGLTVFCLLTAAIPPAAASPMVRSNYTISLSSEENILNNPGFEDVFDPWTRWKSTNIVHQQLDKESHGGARSASAEASEYSKSAFIQILSNLSPDDIYHFSAWTKANLGSGEFYLAVEQQLGKNAARAKSRTLRRDTDWQYLDLYFTPLGRDARVKICLYFDGSGKTWFDDALLRKIPKIDLSGKWLFKPGDDARYATPELDERDWRSIAVPSLWEKAGFDTLEGTAWYRLHFTVPEQWNNRILVAEFGGISKADEAFVNGSRIGQTGSFPPDFENATGLPRKYLISPKLISGRTDNVLAVRVSDGAIGANGGINGTPNFIRAADSSETVSITVSSGGKNGYFIEDEEPSLSCDIANLSPEPRGLTLKYRVSDYHDRSILENVRAIDILPGQSLSVPVVVGKRASGMYYGEFFVEEKGVSITQMETRFCILPSNPGPSGDLRFGVATHLDRLTPERLARSLDLVSLARIPWVRSGFLWRDIAREKGHDTWDRHDALVKAAKTRGIRILPTLAIAPAWAYKNGLPDIEEWKRFVGAVVARYKEDIDCWEIWNEENAPNYWTFGKKNFANFLAAAYDAAKKENPRATIILGGLAPDVPPPGDTDPAFLKAMYPPKGVRIPFDAVGHHPYTGHQMANRWISGRFDEMIAAIKMVMKENADEDRELWLTEMSVSTATRTEKMQAEYLALTWTKALAEKNVGHVFWYDLQNDGENEEYNQHMFGLIRFDATPKAAYVVYRNYIDIMEYAQFEERLALPSEAEAYRFKKGTTNIIAAWAADKECDTTFNLRSDTVTIRNIIGETIACKYTKPSLSLKLTRSPVFIVYP